ncbi:MAG: class I SAM-dependent methyltransferase, partial [Chloroflexota bacterium]|nr:class I SAM-dependent methyltransferase [Chloroflexota bacterium]
VGVGTGANFPYYPPGVEVVAVDFSPRMLEKASEKRDRAASPVHLALMDAQRLAFPDHVFDSVVATFTFCSVPYPRIGLRELKRVCKEKGQVILLEHVLSQQPPLRQVMNLMNPLVVRMGGQNINRDTPGNVRASGLRLTGEQDLLGDVVKLLEAIPPDS